MNIERSRRSVGSREDYEQFSRLLGIGSKMPRGENGFEGKEPISDTLPCKNTKHLAMVYPVKQGWCSIYDPEIALMNGTIFEELNKPFKKVGCSTKCKEGCL
jgi:hypothetical protein